ncbi:MAG: phosphate acyltransferase PlsX [Rhodocyclaceae bacterium]|nr:phosphate acyltransferase PlsX [Rhodocyclaceae bacterium]
MSVTIAVDCMGGDHGPSVTLSAAFDFLRRHPDCAVVLVGREDVLRPMLGNTPTEFGGRMRVHSATEVVEMHEPVASALRNKKDSSMRQAINLVKSGEADAATSAGNTGALMAISRFVLKTLPGIDRPAICGILPTAKGHTYMLDLGANVDCQPEHLLQFGLMGAMLVSALEHKDYLTHSPSVGLLNIGEEDIKGNEVAKKAAELLKESGLNFYGNIEGNDIFKGVTDVVVCDGFVGNAVLKAAEGIVQLMAGTLRAEFSRNLLTKMAALAARPVLRAFKKRFDHRSYNGAGLLGLKGIVFKSHGSADAYAFRCALERSAEAARERLTDKIMARMLALQSPVIQ